MRQAYEEIRAHGLRNFYKGSSIVTLACIPSHALFFINYEIIKKYFDNENQISIIGNALLGGTSNLFHDLIMTPADMIKQRSQIYKNKSNMFIIRDTLRKEGKLSFWRSFPVNLLNNLPHAMLTVTCNENLKVLYQKHIGQLNMYSYFLCAGSAGVITSLVTTPLDNIKTRLNIYKVQ